MRLNKSAVLVAAFVLLYSAGAAAQLSFHDPATNQGILDQVISQFATRAAGWQSIIMAAATRLYWTLVVISMVWTFGMMALRKADIGEFFAEFVRFTIFTGFFWWLLTNGPNFASSIYASLRQLGENAIGVSGLSPSGIVDVGFMIWKQAVTNLSAWQPIDSFVGVALSAGILILLAVIAVNMLLLLVSGWILAYAGIFFLGFGGSRWTSDMAINYYKTVLGVAVQLMTMVLLVGIGNDLLSTFYAKMNKGTLNFEELGVMLVFCLALMLLVNRVPPLVAGIITGASIGHAGIGNFGAGAVVGAAGMAAAAASTSGAMLAAGAANAAGGTQALMAAFAKAGENVHSGADVLTSLWGGGSGAGTREESSGHLSYAEAAGFASSSSWAADTPWQGGHDRAQQKAPPAPGKGKASASRDSAGSGSTRTAEGGPQPGSGGLMASVGKAGLIAADAAANLAKGTAQVAKDAMAGNKEAAMERIAETAGGRIAAAIQAGTAPERRGPAVDSAPTFEGNHLAGADTREVDAEAEVAAFVNRERRFT